ncbi:TetR/AcrR family transcriptional regulator [Acetanaerobacterium elongatum]|uniref:Transcriptional regulator, TetR family n=1 Tax=Acetanaerobacterium elongatum TaxID=258515 RepID=A0A1G9XFL4_9FIRM|nr:TetR/AcrR family transcriptional regulator [Acetanaerobacterium elongatum]SDM95612.1 transcriptional regulator, TetR family [Acetanaerobacterium elongatum]
MQYKKEELMAVILQNAEREFMHKGYQNASLRVIAKNSGTTIGNLYHYFENKEALFETLVKPEYDAFIYLIQNHSGEMIPEEIVQSRDVRVWRAFLREWMQSVALVFTNRFYILLQKSEGSRFAKTRAEFMKVLTEHFIEHLKETDIPIAPEMGAVIAEQLLSGVLYVIAHYDDPETQLTLICDTFLFVVAGVIRLLE